MTKISRLSPPSPAVADAVGVGVDSPGASSVASSEGVGVLSLDSGVLVASRVGVARTR